MRNVAIKLFVVSFIIFVSCNTVFAATDKETVLNIFTQIVEEDCYFKGEQSIFTEIIGNQLEYELHKETFTVASKSFNRYYFFIKKATTKDEQFLVLQIAELNFGPTKDYGVDFFPSVKDVKTYLEAKKTTIISKSQITFNKLATQSKDVLPEQNYLTYKLVPVLTNKKAVDWGIPSGNYSLFIKIFNEYDNSTLLVIQQEGGNYYYMTVRDLKAFAKDQKTMTLEAKFHLVENKSDQEFVARVVKYSTKVYIKIE